MAEFFGYEDWAFVGPPMPHLLLEASPGASSREVRVLLRQP
eukprot:CAMPEP_0197687880 /NCGR_PEP_ID=MMETSP1338-20131121/104607_1 /TAXON_ID=43686 ORGANISM="Pelagodinium beii, Strain RCC1491" /NCGR_SAMPLE_ID=MMETSP1338 /ASSEMBLY_ACC=CAM_ASM_000754 /LENGTH=40 /DNA_ID= /DNA_START= /DNA_END= /DNA_ORIENTATION=